MPKDYGQQITAKLNRAFARMAEEDPVLKALLFPSTPRYRYYEIKAAPRKSRRTFEWTTERADGGKYWCVERRWIKKRGGWLGKIIRKVGFKTRRAAKARAYDWYQKAKGA